MSLSATLDNDIALSAIEEYDAGVFRTLNSSFQFPYDKEDIFMPYEFYFSDKVNPLLGKLYENVLYLLGYSKLYNTLLPFDSIACDEYSTGNVGVVANDSYEVTYTPTNIKIYKKGVLDQTITETQYGQFVNILDVALDGDDLYILDGRFVLKIKINTVPFQFSVFFGGLGSKTSEYRFREPVSLHVDNGNLYVFDVANQIIKQYNDFLAFEKNIETDGAIAVDIYNGEVYQITETSFSYGDTKFQHGVEGASKFILDRTQYGFFWVGSSTKLKKFALNGLEIYDSDRTDLSDFERIGTSLLLVEGVSGTVNRELEYQFTSSILSGEDLLYPLSAIEINPDEFITDMVVNDSIYKFYEMLDDFNKRIFGEYVTILDAGSNYTSVVVSALEVSGVGIDFNDQLFHKNDERISCHAWDRTIGAFFDMMDSTRDRLFGIDTFDASALSGALSGSPLNVDLLSYFTNISWSVGAQSCEGVEPQLFNPIFTPISWEELNNPALSCIPLTSLDCIVVEEGVSA